MAEIFPWLLLAVLISLGAGLAWWLLRAGHERIWALCGLALMAAIAWGIVQARSQTGWDGIASGLIPILVGLPSLAGFGIGSLIGWIGRHQSAGKGNS